SVAESGSCVTITISPRIPWARATPPIAIRCGWPKRLFEDLDQRALARTRRDGLHDRAQRARGLATAADDLAEIRLSDLELVDVCRTLLDELDVNLVRLVDEVDREVTNELGEIGILRHCYAAFAARAVRRTIADSVPLGWAPTESHFW